ncbi:MAG: cupin domain-containing protein, partial [Opitutaceae bacterium]|nr:cupin domain-containing protein [Opitutaceae bacterium]
MSLTNFIGSELIIAIGRLDAAHLLGPWPRHVPARCRRRAQFTPVLYDENHAHEHAELCLLIEGHCVFSLDHAASVLNPGDLVVCPAGRPHGETFVRAGTGYRLVWWSLHRAEPTVHVTRYRKRGGFSLEYQLSLRELPAEAQARVALLRKLAEAKNTPAVEALRESMLTLALALYRRVLDGGEAQVDTRAQLVRRAVEFVRAQSDRPLALADVAHAVHVSPNYLTGLFRA